MVCPSTVTFNLVTPSRPLTGPEFRAWQPPQQCVVPSDWGVGLRALLLLVASLLAIDPTRFPLFSLVAPTQTLPPNQHTPSLQQKPATMW